MQKEVAELLEISQPAVSKREKEVKKVNNATGCAIYIPNLRVKIPKAEHSRIVSLPGRGLARLNSR